MLTTLGYCWQLDLRAIRKSALETIQPQFRASAEPASSDGAA